VPSNEPSVQTLDESAAREMTRHSGEVDDVCKMNYSANNRQRVALDEQVRNLWRLRHFVLLGER
jgi:U3 small nucleolar ribonucleoprotein component